jgi:hypothetical protein
MSKRLPVPPELESLIEKREEETDRRGDKRRVEPGDASAASASANGSGSASAKGQGAAERRKSTDRRQKRRRKK